MWQLQGDSQIHPELTITGCKVCIILLTRTHHEWDLCPGGATMFQAAVVSSLKSPVVIPFVSIIDVDHLPGFYGKYETCILI
jgi:hypothetical protein